MLYDTLIVGNGEVGSSLKKVLEKRKEKKSIKIIDIKDESDFQSTLQNDKCISLHITIPYFNKDFLDYCLTFINCFEPVLVIIHSTVPVRTTERLQALVDKKNREKKIVIVHSPVRGQHPHLEESLLYFVKYIGTADNDAYLLAKKELSNMKTKWFDNPRATELGKLLCTSYYGVCISWHKEMKRICDHFGVKFDDAVTDINTTYNAGYKKFRPNVIRPTLYPPEGAIGGHCVVPNANLLERQLKSKFLELIK